jgi:hypothetical protein
MKAILTIALIVLTQTSAFADTNGNTLRLDCSAPGPTGTQGYRAKLTLKYAAGGQGSMARLRLPGATSDIAMKCMIPAVQVDTRGGDQMYPVAFCNDGVNDAGYSMAVYAGGVTGQTFASVTAKDFAHSRELANLVCRNPNNKTQRY